MWNFKKGLNNDGWRRFYGPDSTVAKESQTNVEVVNSIYSSIMGGSAKESQLGASLAAEAS
jgi:hypothetical protein